MPRKRFSVNKNSDQDGSIANALETIATDNKPVAMVSSAFAML